MKKYSFILFLFLSLSGFGQTKVPIKRFYSNNGTEIDSASSYYYTVSRNSNERLLITSYYRYSNKVMLIEEAVPLSDKLTTRTYYYENGDIKSKGMYENGTAKGEVKMFYSDSILQADLFFNAYNPLSEKNLVVEIANYWDSHGNQLVKDGEGICSCSLQPTLPEEHHIEKGNVRNKLKDGVWLTFEDDKRVFEENYENGKLLRGVFFDEDGQQYEYEVVNKTAVPLGGFEAFYRNVGTIIQYPKKAKRLGVEGKVFVEFIVEKDGSLSNIKPIKGIGMGCDEEAVRVVGLSSIRWIPGKQHGKPARTRFVLPLNFRLK